jgi:hypothetical protein
MAKIIESTLLSLDDIIEDPAKWVGGYLHDNFQKGALDTPRSFQRLDVEKTQGTEMVRH